MEAGWYYTKGDAKKQGPVTADRILEMSSEGSLRPKDLVWTDGMEEWAPLETCTIESTKSPQELQRKPAAQAGMLGVIGGMLILAGIPLLCVFLTGLLFICAGITLLSARKELLETGGIDQAFQPVMNKILSAMMLVALSTIALMILGLFVFFASLSRAGF